MAYKDPRFVDIYQEIMEFRKQLHQVQKELRREKNRQSKRKLELCIGYLKRKIAWSLLNCGEYQKGLAIYQSLSWKTFGEQKYIGIGRALVETEQYGKARRVLKKGLKRFPKSTLLYITMGISYHLEGHNDVALLYYECALQYEPTNQNVLYQKAVSLECLGCYEEAESILRELNMRYPDDPDYIAWMGHCLFGQGHHEEAIKYYIQAKNMGYLRPELCGRLSISYLNMGFKNDALQVAEEGVREFPDNCPGLYALLGNVYFEMGWVKEARNILNEGLRRFPGDEDIEYMLEYIEHETDDPDKGKKPPILGLVLLLILIQKKLGKKK
jgi:tetratricopeptide (TPR) repeat protein